jgi:hypothetical protein
LKPSSQLQAGYLKKAMAWCVAISGDPVSYALDSLDLSKSTEANPDGFATHFPEDLGLRFRCA